MSKLIYFDTSALAKWYIRERASEAVESYIQRHGPVAISDLTVVEMRSLVARRRRKRHFHVAREIEIFVTFQEDIRRGALICHSLPAGLAAASVNLMGQLPHAPLRALDALHLALAREIGTEVLATSHQVMAAAARDIGFLVEQF